MTKKNLQKNQKISKDFKNNLLFCSNLQVDGFPCYNIASNFSLTELIHIINIKNHDPEFLSSIRKQIPKDDFEAIMQFCQEHKFYLCYLDDIVNNDKKLHKYFKRKSYEKNQKIIRKN